MASNPEPTETIVAMPIPIEFVKFCNEIDVEPVFVLNGFIADVCELRRAPWETNGSDERRLAAEYIDRCRVNWPDSAADGAWPLLPR